jgi:hypothetical protein
MNIFAYTENEPAPAYISINDNNGDIPVISVRSRGESATSYISMRKAELRALRDALTTHLDKVEQA